MPTRRSGALTSALLRPIVYSFSGGERRSSSAAGYSASPRVTIAIAPSASPRRCTFRRHALLELQQSAPPDVFEFVETLSARRRNGVDTKRQRGLDLGNVLFAEQVELGEHHTMRFGGQLGGILRDLRAELVVFMLPVEGVYRNEKRQQSCALYMAQELQAEPPSFVRTLDDARNV